MLIFKFVYPFHNSSLHVRYDNILLINIIQISLLAYIQRTFICVVDGVACVSGTMQAQLAAVYFYKNAALRVQLVVRGSGGATSSDHHGAVVLAATGFGHMDGRVQLFALGVGDVVDQTVLRRKGRVVD